MLTIKRLFRLENLSLILYNLVFAVIILANFPDNKFFIGWDALSPELNFPENFSRVIYAFWQENQGLGLLGGHGFAATLPHNLVILILRLFLPLNAVRTAFTLLFLYFGGLGVYFLGKLILQSILKARNEVQPIIIDLACLIGSLFYVLNLGTLQMFYIQLEAFVFHFTFLPWLFYIAIRLLEKTNRKLIIGFIAVNFFASTQGFIPPLFVAYFFALSIFLFIYIALNKFDKNLVKRGMLIILGTLVVNIYWLIPLGYYTLTRSGVYLNSYNNLQSTPEVLEKNKIYGNLAQVALIKGFIWEGIHSTDGVNISYVFDPWVNHHKNILVPFIGYSLFAIAVIGLIYSLIINKKPILVAFSGVFIFFFTGLTTNFFPFSIITNLLQNLPIYKQAFRAAFTKFSIGLSFSYSLFIAVGLIAIIEFIYYFLRNRSKVSEFVSKKISIVFMSIVLAGCLYYGLPTFAGNLFYKRLIVELPQPYLDIIEYYKTQPDGRIADLPVDCPEGWHNYSWGYTGSGFYWYGIKQPIMSRTFDVWNQYNENYYWELTQAVREQNFDKVDNIFDKYDISWILYDPNLIHCRDASGFDQYNGFINHLNASVQYDNIKNFSDKYIKTIKIYRNKSVDSKSYIKIVDNLINVGPAYNWNDNDSGYFLNQDYQSSSNNNWDIYYPFRTLFNKRQIDNRNFTIESDEDWFTLATHLPKNLKGSNLSIPQYKETERAVPVSITIENISPGQYSVFLQYLLPDIVLDNQLIITSPPAIKLGEFSSYDELKPDVYLNGFIRKNEDDNLSYKTLFNSLGKNTISIETNNEILFGWDSDKDLSFNQIINTPNYITIPDFNDDLFIIKTPRVKNSVYEPQVITEFEKFTPKPCNELSPSDNNKFEIGKEGNTEYVRLISQNSRQCITFNFDTVITNFNYIVEITTRHVKGNNPAFYISNKKRVHYLDTYLYPENKGFEKHQFILPGTFNNELGYDIYFDNYSRTKEQTINDFAGISLSYFPYDFIKNITIIPKDSNQLALPSVVSQNIEVKHPNPSYYQVTSNNEQLTSDNNYLVLSQAYDKGWKAYQANNRLAKWFPFIFGTEIKDHVLINNWANGWSLENGSGNTIIIFYLPQLLQYFGLAVFVLGIIFVLRYHHGK